ncbi:hypothetical protein [Paenibacillus thiaminolyticus]|uniref:hypothetical protein n=1 Tax=Paenibacillus thiaminolyticus TaxID=49283 RepID=UPI0030B95243
MNRLHSCLRLLRQEQGSAMMIVFVCMILLFLAIPLLLQTVGASVAQQHLISEQRIAQEMTIGNMEGYIAYLNKYRRSMNGAPVSPAQYRDAYAGMGDKTVQTGSGWSTSVHFQPVQPSSEDGIAVDPERFYIQSAASLQKGNKEMIYSFLKSPRFGETQVSPDPDERDCMLDRILLEGKFWDQYDGDREPPLVLPNGSGIADITISKHNNLQGPIGIYLDEKRSEAGARTKPAADYKCEECKNDLSTADAIATVPDRTIDIGSVADRTPPRGRITIGARDRSVNLVGTSLTFDSYVNTEIYGNLHVSSLTLHNGGHLNIHGDLIVDGSLAASDWKDGSGLRTIIQAKRIIVKNRLDVNDNAEVLAAELLYAETMTTAGNATVGGDRIVVRGDLTVNNKIFTNEKLTRDLIVGSLHLQGNNAFTVSGDILVKNDLRGHSNTSLEFGGLLAVGGNMRLEGSYNRLRPGLDGEQSSGLILDGGICVGIPDWEPRRER